MKTNIVIDISPLIPYLVKFLFSSYGPKCCQSVKLQVSLKFNISRKKWMIKCIFSVQINIKVFCKMIISFWVCLTRHAQSIQNKRFAYLCNISRKAWQMNLIFLPADNHKSFLQDDCIILCVHSQVCPKYLKQQVCNISAISQEKHEGWSWFFACR